MQTHLYPPQEPFSESMQLYHDDLIARGKNLTPLLFSYGEDPYQSLALFPAKKPDGRVLIFFHGGGWTNGYKEWMYSIAPAMNELGISFISAGYRLAPQHLFPVGHEDTLRALEWTVKNIHLYNGDPNKIFVSGHSAGGHYATLLTVSSHSLAGFSANHWIRGCAPISGIYYFGDNDGMATRPRFLGPPEKKQEKLASPLYQLSNDLPPFLLSWGESDFPHLIRQAQEMTLALESYNIDVKNLVLPNCNHFTASYVLGDQEGVWAQSFNNWTNTLINQS